MTTHRGQIGLCIALLLALLLNQSNPLTEAAGNEFGEIRITYDGRSQFASWAPDGKSILINRWGQVVRSGPSWQMLTELWQTDIKGKEAKKVSDNASFPVWSPDGRQIAYLSFLERGKGLLWFMDVATGAQKTISTADWTPLTSLADGRLVFAQEGKLVALDREGRKESTEVVTLDHPFVPSPSGDKVAISDGVRLSASDLQGREEPIASDVVMGPFAWSPDGQHLAYIKIDEGLRSQLWVTTLDGTPLLLAEGQDEHFEKPDWSPDGKSLAFSRCPRGSGTSAACDIWTVGSDGQGLKDLTPGEREESSPLWSPDGRYIVFQREGDVWLLDMERAGAAAPRWRPAEGAHTIQSMGSAWNDIVSRAYVLLRRVFLPQSGEHLTPPATIRVRHDSRNYYRSGIASGQIDVFDFETYVKYVVACEVPRTWEPEALKAQGVAARSFGWYYVLNNYHLRSSEWDVTDWTYDQCVRPVHFPEVDSAVEATGGQYLWHSNWDDGAFPLDSPIIAMYSSRNGDPTRTRDDIPARFPYLKAVNDPVSFGDTRYGHGWGLSQWGAQRWATGHGWNYQQILTHYYTDITVEAPAESGPDTDPPVASTILPWTNFYLTSNRVLIVANASDGNSGMYRVSFWARYDDGGRVDWHLLSRDYDGSDGWSSLWDLSSLPNQPRTEDTIQIATNAMDAEGRIQPDPERIAFVGLDRTPPTGLAMTFQNPSDPSQIVLALAASDEGGSGVKEMAFSHNWIWEGEDLPHEANSGVKIYDPEALNGYAQQGRAGVDSPGCWFGPYTHQLPSGPYRAYFRLKTSDVATTAEVATLDVVDDYGQTTLGLLRLQGIDFREPDVYQEFGVDLNYNYDPSGTPGLEFRTYFTGAADLALDRVIVVTYPEPYQTGIPLDEEEVQDLRVKFIDGAGNVSADSIPTPITLPHKIYLPQTIRGY